MQSKLSKKREEKRNSPETLQFREKVIGFLEKVKADDEIVYSIKKDLSTKTDMEFYGQQKSRMRITKSNMELVVKYVELLGEYDDQQFAVRLLRKLSVQQNQAFRKLAQRSAEDRSKEKRLGKQNGVWDHAIPTKVVIDEIIEMLRNKDLSDLRKLLTVYEHAGQKFITKEQDRILSAKYRDSMPAQWDWKRNSDPMARYAAMNIDLCK